MKCIAVVIALCVVLGGMDQARTEEACISTADLQNIMPQLGSPENCPNGEVEPIYIQNAYALMMVCHENVWYHRAPFEPEEGVETVNFFLRKDEPLMYFCRGGACNLKTNCPYLSLNPVQCLQSPKSRKISKISLYPIPVLDEIEPELWRGAMLDQLSGISQSKGCRNRDKEQYLKKFEYLGQQFDAYCRSRGQIYVRANIALSNDIDSHFETYLELNVPGCEGGLHLYEEWEGRGCMTENGYTRLGDDSESDFGSEPEIHGMYLVEESSMVPLPDMIAVSVESLRKAMLSQLGPIAKSKGCSDSDKEQYLEKFKLYGYEFDGYCISRDHLFIKANVAPLPTLNEHFLTAIETNVNNCEEGLYYVAGTVIGCEKGTESIFLVPGPKQS